MRLDVIENGLSWTKKIKFKVIGLVSGMRIPDVVKTLSYRSGFFGKPFSNLVETCLRESSVWSHGECELFAAFVSNRNQCPF